MIQNKFIRQYFPKMMFGLGLILFASLVYKLGPKQILLYLKTIGWNFSYIILVLLFNYFILALAWKQYFIQFKTQVSLLRLFLLKLAGEAANNMTPLSWGGGDPLRIVLLKKTLPGTQATASTVVDRALHSLAVALFVLTGSIIFLLRFKFSLDVEIPFVLLLILLIALAYLLFHRSKSGLFLSSIALLKKLRIKKEWSEKTLGKAKEVDQLCIDFFKKDKLNSFFSLFLRYLGKNLSVVEIMLAAYFLNFPLDFATAYLLASVSVLVNLLFAFIPGSLGVMEGSYAGIFSLLNLDPSIGASIQIIRRVRALTYSALGLIVIYFMTQRNENKNRPKH